MSNIHQMTIEMTAYLQARLVDADIGHAFCTLLPTDSDTFDCVNIIVCAQPVANPREALELTFRTVASAMMNNGMPPERMSALLNEAKKMYEEELPGTN